jgi:hypothetical protein
LLSVLLLTQETGIAGRQATRGVGLDVQPIQETVFRGCLSEITAAASHRPTRRKRYFFFCVLHRTKISLIKQTVTAPPRFSAARAKPTIVVGRFCGRGMGFLREGIPPFLKAVLWFISVGTEMNEKFYKCVFCVFVQHKSFYSSGIAGGRPLQELLLLVRELRRQQAAALRETVLYF